MSRNLTVAFLFAVASLAGCTTNSHNPPNLFVTASGDRKATTFTPTGYGWIPESKIEISVYGEPNRDADGELYSESWRVLGTVTADNYGMFGFNSGAFTAWVPRRVCGFPPDWLSDPYFWAIDRINGLFIARSMGKNFWFTFTPCS